MADLSPEVRQRALDNLRALLVDITRRIDQAQAQAAEVAPKHVAEMLGETGIRVGIAIRFVDIEIGVADIARGAASGPLLAPVCQVSGDGDHLLTCYWRESGGYRCERIDPHDDSDHSFGQHTIEHARRGNGYACSAITSKIGEPNQ